MVSKSLELWPVEDLVNGFWERVEGPPYHTMDLDTVNQLLKSDLEDGLPESRIEELRAQYSYNEMEGEGGVNPVKLLIKQFTNIMILILLIAMVCQ